MKMVSHRKKHIQPAQRQSILKNPLSSLPIQAHQCRAIPDTPKYFENLTLTRGTCRLLLAMRSFLLTAMYRNRLPISGINSDPVTALILCCQNK
jgi:hypothetical protein